MTSEAIKRKRDHEAIEQQVVQCHISVDMLDEIIENLLKENEELYNQNVALLRLTNENTDNNRLIKSLEIVYDLARDNSLDEQETIFNSYLLEEYKNQQAALNFIGKHLVNIKSLR